ncbi:MAG: ETC complex I subunit [Alphaproteobacteria bacterium]|nr:ETC complex I subunit [Alphaproteobacteria bacterium]MBE8220790.1 ETC complex I subunit [Alphaproteobacteria bacterium]
MNARIYQPAKTAMSSGQNKCKQWVLEFATATPHYKDALMGWNRVDDTRQQVRLKFDSLEAAQAYAVANNIAVRVMMPKPHQHRAKSYAANFR